MTTTIKSYAKINLSLLVYAPQKDTYHPIHSVFQEIDFFDTLHIQSQKKKECTIHCTNPDVPTGKENILCKVYDRLSKDLDHGYIINLEKNIPMGGGLGGGSSNAAQFLKHINKTLQRPKETLIKTAKDIGADVPFFLTGGTARVTGIGEVIDPIDTLTQVQYLLITPPIHCSTAKIFNEYDKQKQFPTHSPTREQLGENSLKSIVFELYPIYKEIENHVETLYMSGTGATTFIPFTDPEKCKAMESFLKKKYPKFFIKTCLPIRSC